MNARDTALAPLIYFGKLPCRGDFVRGSQQPALIHTLDHWLTQAMEQLATDPAWKGVFDAAQPTAFAFLGTRSTAGLAGHLLPSQDASGRRFPFLAATSFEVAEPLRLLARAPLALHAAWATLERLTTGARAATDYAAMQEAMARTEPPPPAAGAAPQAAYAEFLDLQTLASAEALLAPPAARCSLRQTLLALGLLLQPVLAQGQVRLDKALVLPLGHDPAVRLHLATLWLDLVTPFFKRGDFEVALFATRWAQRPMLVVGFNGASPATLHTVLTGRPTASDSIVATDAQWVEAYAEQDWGVRKLSTYLREPQLSLRQAVATFREVFLGE
ncbi:MAG: type VI secretion system-associated protein TagF [Burkholderiales bacterium]|nr:type VI secretion system-associated protein TagF [Burkholderiales bacterium]